MNADSFIWGTPDEIEEDLDELRRNHPKWDERVFLHWAAEIYKTIDYAKRKGRLGIIKQSMTGSCFDKLKKNVQQGGFRNLNLLNVQGVQIEKVGEEGENDFIDVRFVSERDKVLLIEHYRFTRYRYEEASDLAGPRAAGDVCPHCGAKILFADQWQCDYCGTILAEQSVGWTIELMLKEGEYAG